MRILSTNTDGQSEFQAWGETVRLVGTCTKKRVWGESRIPRHSVSLTAGVSIILIDNNHAIGANRLTRFCLRNQPLSTKIED